MATKAKPVVVEKVENPEVKKTNSNYRVGQRFAAPEDGDGTRLFYETLYEEKPTSTLARRWLMENGCLTNEEQAKAFKELKSK